LEILTASTELADRVKENTRYFREGIASTGFEILGKDHPISPVLLGDAALSQEFSGKLLEKNIYAIGFFYPVVPQGRARIRTQISAAHTRDHLDQALEAFVETGRELGL
jgi:glycine C-acetyltransferase